MKMKISLLAACAISLTIILSSFSASAFTFGVCGHQIYGGDIWNDPETQFSTMHRYGLTTYRFDVPLNSDPAHANVTDKLDNLVAIAKKYHIVLHPIVYVPFNYGENATDDGKYPDTEAGLEAQGYNRMYPLALKYAAIIHDWELQNELSLKKGVKSGLGLSASDYETPLAHKWAAVLRGMSKAVHDAGNKSGKHLSALVDTTYVDFGLIPFMENNGVAIDKVAYHYYFYSETSPYKVYGPKGSGVVVDVFAELAKMGKPVIINEFNSGEIYTQPYDDAKALVGFKKHLDYITQQKEANIEGLEFYELYDEPGKSPAESNFGLMKDATHLRIQMLVASAYTCGKLSEEDKKDLISSRLFTKESLYEKRKSCRLPEEENYRK